MACQACGVAAGCGCSSPSSPPTSATPASNKCNEIPSQMITCFSGQSLPPELPTEGIPASAISYTPPPGGCVPSAATVQEYLDKIATLYFDLFCPVAIASTSGGCSVLAVKNNKVVTTTFQSLFDSCLACIKPSSICPGKAGEVLITVGGVAQWGPAPQPPAGAAIAVADSATIDMTLTGTTVSGQVIRDGNPANLLTETPAGLLVLPMGCAEIKTAIETGACIADGTIAKTIGFNAAGGLVKAVPAAGSTAPTCAQVKTALESSACIPTGTAATYISFNAAGALVKAPPPASSPALDCAGFQSLLSGCPPVASSVVPQSFIALNSSAEPQKFSVCPMIKAVVNRSADNSTGGCLDDMATLTQRVLGYDETTKEAKWVLAQQLYKAECRGSITVNQNLSLVPQTLNDITTFWASVVSPTYERGLRGAGSWFNPSTARFTIGRAGWYRAHFTGLMIRVKTNLVAAKTIGHVYAGITIVRAAGTIDGTAYPALVGILRTGESPIVADGKNQDFIFSGSYEGPLNTGDQVWIRVVCSNVPDNAFSFNQLEVLDDGKGSFVLMEDQLYTSVF